MGKNPDGRTLSWEEVKKSTWLVKKIGILQFLNIYHRCKDISGCSLQWGDEIEFNLLTLDNENQMARLCLITPQLFKKLNEKRISADPHNIETHWSLECASHVIEGTPGVKPYGSCLSDMNLVEINMKLRRKVLYEVLERSSIFPLCLSVFPRMGCPGFTEPQYVPDPIVTGSYFYPKAEAWAGHPRYVSIWDNIFNRRGEKVYQNIPIYRDTATPTPFLEPFLQNEETAKSDHIYLDCSAFGTATCLQVTIQGYDINETRHLYDQLSVFCPIMLAITAGSPIHRGYLSDVDSRWGMMTDACDDRNAEERDPHNERYIPNSRYGCISMYLDNPDYNDTYVPINETAYYILLENGIDEVLAKHIANIFVRDPLCLFAEDLDQDIENDVGHFENLQSTNWQSMRFKVPPPNSNIGWRVEFRVMDVQITEFENAAFATFIVLLTRTILSFKLNFIIPFSKLEDNMKRSIVRDAIGCELFYFRKDVLSGDDSNTKEDIMSSSHDDEYKKMSVDTIINGNTDFIGVIPLIRMYLNNMNVDVETMITLGQYLDFLSKKASGTVSTTATWIRQFVHTHPDYKQDSIVGEKIVYDLITKIKDISEEKAPCNDLQGK